MQTQRLYKKANPTPGYIKFPNRAGLITGGVMGLNELANADSLGEGLENFAGTMATPAITYGITEGLPKYGPRIASRVAQSGTGQAIGNAVSNIAKRPLVTSTLNAARKIPGVAKTMRYLPAAGKFIPGAAAAGFGIYDAAQRAGDKDYLGATISGVSSGLMAIPHPITMGLGAIGHVGLGVRDYLKGNNDTSPPSQPKLEEFKREETKLPTQPLGVTNPASSNPPVNSLTPSVPTVPNTMQQNKVAEQTHFSKEIASPSGGTSSDLYSAISPMVYSERNLPQSKADEERIAKLRDDMRKGIVSLEYLTGLKKNKGKTYYDENPVSATALDLLSKSPLLGAGIAAGGVGLNYYRQAKNMGLTEPASMARGNNSKDYTNPEKLLNSTKGTSRADIVRVFGDMEADPAKRLKIIDRLNRSEAGQGFFDKYLNLVKPDEQKYKDTIADIQSQLGSAGLPDSESKRLKTLLDSAEKEMSAGKEQYQKELQKLLGEARASKGSSALNRYADLLQSLQHAKEQGGYRPYLGEDLNKKLSNKGVGGKIKKHILPAKEQAIVDLLEKLKITGAHSHYDEALIKDILSEVEGGRNLDKRFLNDTLKRVGDKKLQSSGLRKFTHRYGLPLATGAGVAAGGLGLYHLIKAIQNQIEPKEKVDEWKRTLLKSRGNFEAANRI
jgi:hypothetical protein